MRSRAHYPRGGRPPLNRGLRQWNISLPVDLDASLSSQAGSLGLTYGEYLRQILAEAHDWHGQHLPELQYPLPIAISVDELRRRTAALTSEDCRRPLAGPKIRRGVRADRELAETITSRAAELDVLYTEYLTSIYREAMDGQSAPSGVQGALLDLPDKRQRARLREESLAS